MDLEHTIVDVLRVSGQPMTFEDVVRGVAERLEGDIRAKLNQLADHQQIERLIGDRYRPSRYQATSLA